MSTRLMKRWKELDAAWEMARQEPETDKRIKLKLPLLREYLKLSTLIFLFRCVLLPLVLIDSIGFLTGHFIPINLVTWLGAVGIILVINAAAQPLPDNY